MEKVLCNYCKSSSYDILYELPDLYLGKREVLYTLVKCRNCGLIYQNPRPTQDEISASYPTSYESYNFEHNGSWLNNQFRQYGLEKRCKSITSIKMNPGYLLDIGCSTGLFLNTIRTKYGWKTNGVEPNQYSSKIAQEKYHLDVFHGSLEQAAYSPNYFDAITLWDVLEHLPDPSYTIQEIRRILKTDGILVLRVPNFDSCDAKLFGPYWAGLDLPRHFYVFSQLSLIRLLEKNGYRVIKKTSNIGSYPMFIISLRFMIINKIQDISRQNIITKLINHPLFLGLFSPYIMVCSHYLCGPAMTITASKNPDPLITND